ncbi:hypothetical protein C0Q70_03082 [Pomacea canaliculata]|uniref:Uncharacterized protein n=1 Tax=Pomacea canaliculata TaxID=400727 RepID=A0A2T7PRQ7_POMCA|nr:hypothetical protein C0Q70_03082 [Pomacea canaliculata]
MALTNPFQVLFLYVAPTITHSSDQRRGVPQILLRNNEPPPEKVAYMMTVSRHSLGQIQITQDGKMASLLVSAASESH